MEKAKIRNSVKIRIFDINILADFSTFYNLAEEDKEHFSVSYEIQKSKYPLVRIHSECITGDVFYSERCDCGHQLKESLRLIKNEGGILIYLRQEGRGIGLYNKIDAYKFQDLGLNTYQANEIQNLPSDSRSYLCAAQILASLGVYEIRLLTNNPDKIEQISQYGIKVVKQIPTGIYLTKSNKKYLESKMRKSKHTIDFKNAKCI